MNRRNNYALSPVLSMLMTIASLPHACAEEPRANIHAHAARDSGQFFARQYHVPDTSFCNAAVCADFNRDGQRELLFASRATGQLQMRQAADGQVIWSRKLAGDQQSISACDLDGDGDLEILYTVSTPGRLYVLDDRGQVQRQWTSNDHKLGNAPVILDANDDGQLEGLFGSRNKSLVRLDMASLTLLESRPDWSQCGCHTSAMDVDLDGRWDLFAGSGDDATGGKGVLHRYDPVTLQSVWSYATNDNASSADAVLVDIDADNQVEIVKSVDNYGGDSAHDAVYAFETDGTLLWKTPGLSGEDSPNVADLDGDGEVEIVGMTFGCEIYCLDAKGRVRWQVDLRPELTDENAHAYLAPILCDLNGDRELEILALTNGGYFDASGRPGHEQLPAVGRIFALSMDGTILAQFITETPRYWGDAYVCNVDDDPYLELIVSGSGGLDVIQTRGIGTGGEHLQRRRSYQRLNVFPWDYEDTYFLDRGTKSGVKNLADSLVLDRADDGFRRSGIFTTELLTLPPNAAFTRLAYQRDTPKGTNLQVNVLDQSGDILRSDVPSETLLTLSQPVRLEFRLSTTSHLATPILRSYRLSFDRVAAE